MRSALLIGLGGLIGAAIFFSRDSAAAVAGGDGSSESGLNDFGFPGGIFDFGGGSELEFENASTNSGSVFETFGDFAGILGGIVGTKPSGFSVGKIPKQYAAAIIEAEDANGIPRNLLARLLYQECRWRTDIITGTLKSSAGAIGIAQFLPATAKEYGVNPYDAFSSIRGAGVYIARLYKSFGSWTEALAAYNWGQGNVRRKGIAAAPLETRNYYSQILSDVGGGLA